MQKPLVKYLFAAASLLGFAMSSAATAAVSIDYVDVGNAGNAADATGYGAVAYEYRIAKNETTIGQYAEFLNAVAKSDPYGLYAPEMATDNKIKGISRSGADGSYSYTVTAGSGNKPITYVTWFDAARFVNWLHNGQGNGDTETGAYALNGATSGIFTAQAGATVWLPTEDEWYKAAYYDPEKNGTGGYWLHANRSDTMTSNTIGVAGAANYYHQVHGYAVYGVNEQGISDVGEYGANSTSYYGTNDQGGNVWEWNDAISGSNRNVRGGTWYNGDANLRSTASIDVDPSYFGYVLGFRVASAVPEPSVAGLMILCGAALFIRRKR